jgi:hypothetical protein
MILSHLMKKVLQSFIVSSHHNCQSSRILIKSKKDMTNDFSKIRFYLDQWRQENVFFLLVPVTLGHAFVSFIRSYFILSNKLFWLFSYLHFVQHGYSRKSCNVECFFSFKNKANMSLEYNHYFRFYFLIYS